MTKNKPLRVVVDTNLFVSGSIIKRGNPYELLQAWRNRAFVLLVSDATEMEIAEVLVRPEIQEEYHLTTDEIEETLRLLQTDAQKCQPAVMLPVTIRDLKDEKILALAIGGQADYLVTGNEDLLVLKTYESGEILTVAAFLRLLKPAEEKAA